MRTANEDVIGAKCMRADDGNLSLDDTLKKLVYPFE